MNILHKSLKSDNTPNILIYGHPSINKRNILINELNKLYNIETISKTTLNDIMYTKTNIYYEFDIKTISNKNYDNFVQIIKNITISKNYYTDLKNKIIILNNFNGSKKNQNILRVIIEKYRSTTIFILVTDLFAGVIEPIKSRCLSIRIPSLTNKEKRKIIYESIPYKEIDHKFYDVIYEINDTTNIQKTIKLKETHDKGYTNPYQKICDKLINIYDTNKFNKNIYYSLREICYNITKNNLRINHFYNIFLTRLLQKNTIIDKKKIKLIYLFSESQYNYIKSYRSIIIVESLLFNVYNLLTT